jgi:hypothetical protein
LLNLLNDILDLSKIEAGKIELEMGVFEPEQLVRETRNLFSGSAASKDIQIECLWHGASGQRYRADAYRIRQMLSNLAGNAVKFTARGSVCVESREIERREKTALLEFAVTDTGVGIATEKQSELFQPFAQADNSTTREFGGTGLGLSIVRSLARLMGGDAGLDSQAGVGSRFWFRIEAGIVQPGEESRQAERPMTSVAYRTRKEARILVVEDNAVNRKVIESLLAKLDLRVELANDGQQAVEAVTQSDMPDVILMDIQMPVMDGLQATRLIRAWERQNGHGRRIPIVAMTANAFESDRLECLAAGMDEFLSKPYRFEELDALLGKLIPAANVAQET